MDKTMQESVDEVEGIDADAVKNLLSFQVESTSLKSKVTYFGLSLTAFIVVGLFVIKSYSSLTVYDLVILTLVLFIHEAGHYLSMRRFGYRNLKMFFIPLFGAAVKGYSCTSVAKESIAYLLGPIPGILIGCICIGIHYVTGVNIWLNAAFLFIVINTANLLPLYPLDGGRFIFGIMPLSTYRIQRWVQITIILIAIYVMFHFDLRIGLLIGLALGAIGNLHRHNKIAAKLAMLDISENEIDPNSVPPEVARKVVEITQQEAADHNMTSREIAESAWAAWIRAHAKQPSRSQTLYLLGIYLAALVVGIFASYIFLYPSLKQMLSY
jgi:Zn-dependent protease